MKRLGTYLLGIWVIFLMFSCIEDQDFNQYEDLTITPTYEASILYVEVPERTINLVNGLNTYSQTFNFDAFAEDIFSERVIEGTITYEVANTTSKPFEFTMQFLDDSGNVLESEIFQMGAEPSATLRRDVAYGPAGQSIDILRNTSSISLSAINLGDNSSTSSQPNPLASVKSSGKFTVRLK